MPDFVAYHRSIGPELEAVKDRVRSLVRHWPTDGSFKEVVLRTVLKRHLPETLFVGTGFVVTATDCSKQIDVLVVDKEHPRLFWEGDFVVVTPEAVRAVIEVKTGFDRPGEVEEAILKAAANKSIWCRTPYGWKSFVGLFAYEERGDHEEAILRSLKAAHQKDKRSTIDCVAYGRDLLFDLPGIVGNRKFPGWVSRRTDGMAAASFIGKLTGYFSVQSRDSVWKVAERFGKHSARDAYHSWALDETFDR